MRRQTSAAALVSAALLLVSGPPLHGQRPMADRAEIRRDTFGIPHIIAVDEEAAGFAFGYAMAEDHAAEIGRRYLQARGEAASHFGPAEVETDLAMRRLDNHAAARLALAQQIGKDFRRWLQGFAAGVNHYVAAHRETLPAWMPVVGPAGVRAHVRHSCGRPAFRASPGEVRAGFALWTRRPRHARR